MSEHFQAFGVRAAQGEGATAAQLVVSAARAQGVSVGEYAAQQAGVERDAAEVRDAERRVAGTMGLAVVEHAIEFRAA